MKKIYFISMAAASLMLASCSNDDMPAPENGEFATVAVSVQLPDGLQTRYGEGDKANQLHYAVYAKGTTTPLPVCINGTDKNATEGLATIKHSTTLTLQLANGQEYDMVFWADVQGNPYYEFKADAQTINANYSTLDAGTPANLEELDAFYCAKTYKVSGNASISAQLYRPFAQVNVVTDDLETAKNGGFVPANSSLKTTVATSLNLMDGTVTGDETEVTFAANALPEGTMTINGKEYDYIGMNYLLVPAEKSLREMEFILYADGTDNAETHVYNFNSVPVQRNYRTNIYGSLLTSSQNFNVEILPGFFDPNYDYEVVTNFADLKALLEGGNSNVLISQDITVTSACSVDEGYVANVAVAEGVTVTADKKRVQALKVTYGGTLNLNGTGKFVGPSNKTSGWMQTAAVICEKGTLNIYGNLTFDGGSGNEANNAVYVGSGTTNIYGGYFYTGLDKDGKPNACILVDAYTMPSLVKAECNIYGGVFEAANPQYLLNIQDDVRQHCTLLVYGGTFVGFNPADNSADGEHTNYVAPGYKSVETTWNGKQAWQVVKE